MRELAVARRAVCVLRTSSRCSAHCAAARLARSATPRRAAPQPPAAPQAEATEPQEFVATIKACGQTVPNSYVITLDNGQIWRQTYAEWYPLRPGQKVRMRPSRWGGTFSLTADEANGFIQVKRVR